MSSALPRFAASQLGRLLPVVASVISNLRHAGHLDLCFGRHYSEHGFSAEFKKAKSFEKNCKSASFILSISIDY